MPDISMQCVTNMVLNDETIVQCQPDVFDVGPTLHKCHTNVSCLLGWPVHRYQSYSDLMKTKTIGSEELSIHNNVAWAKHCTEKIVW